MGSDCNALHGYCELPFFMKNGRSCQTLEAGPFSGPEKIFLDSGVQTAPLICVSQQ